MPSSDEALTYRDAGVDIDAGDALVERIKPFAKRTMRPEVLAVRVIVAGLIKLGLLENASILAFDARLNPGCSEKVERQLALCMLKNIEKMR